MSFSVPRCRSPICGSARSTTSPSISSTRRSTPCAAGCCGPKFIEKFLSWTSAMSGLRSRRWGGSRRRGRGRLRGFLVAGQLARHALPGRQEIEAAEILRQLHRLVDDALLLLVVAHLDIAGEREILAQRMALEPVIGEEAPEIRMIGKEDAVEVPRFALEPPGGTEHGNDGRDRPGLVGHDLHAD